MTKHAFSLRREALFRVLCSKNIGGGPIKWHLLEEKRKKKKRTI
jgi:hypothetical protein